MTRPVFDLCVTRITHLCLGKHISYDMPSDSYIVLCRKSVLSRRLPPITYLPAKLHLVKSSTFRVIYCVNDLSLQYTIPI